jgi:Mor family transcriptional regulator
MILDSKVDEIKKQIDDGVKLKVIAKKYNSSQTTITKLIKKHKLK